MPNPRIALAVLAWSALACSAPDAPAPAPATAEPATPAVPGSLVFAAQPGWVSETPASSMRKAQFRLPAAGGDAADATLVVYWFGPTGGGGVEANVERWVGQFEQPDGSDSHAALATDRRTVHGMEVVEVDLAGTYVAETSPGSGERVHEEGWRLLASILAAPEGDYYAKLVGPAATVASHAASYRAFIDGLGSR